MAWSVAAKGGTGKQADRQTDTDIQKINPPTGTTD